jgi:hypothetical protein
MIVTPSSTPAPHTSVLDNRAMVVAEAAKLRAEGNERDAKAWDRQLPKWDKLIADYGLRRFARP